MRIKAKGNRGNPRKSKNLSDKDGYILNQLEDLLFQKFSKNHGGFDGNKKMKHFRIIGSICWIRKVAQNPSVEDEFGGGTFTFTSAHDPSESNGVYKNSTEFTMAILNQASPLMLGYGGNYVNARELRLECIFPVQFPFGIGGPKMNRPTQIS